MRSIHCSSASHDHFSRHTCSSAYLTYTPEPPRIPLLHRAGRALLDAAVKATAWTLVFAACLILTYQSAETFGPRAVPAAGVVLVGAALIAWAFRTAFRFPPSGRAS